MTTLLICVGYMSLSTLVGVVAGLFAKSSKPKAHSFILAFSAGIKMYTSFSSLILPSVSTESDHSFILSVIGFAAGVLFISTLKVAPKFLERFLVGEGCNDDIARVLLFVTAVAVHKIPEGIAAGLACTKTLGEAVSLSLGLTVQNAPDGFILSAPLVMAGMKKQNAFLIGAAASLLSALGSVVGYVGASLLSSALEALLAFAGGMIVYVTVSLIGEAENGKIASSAFALGAILMMFFERYV